jgi:hypothetical protein
MKFITLILVLFIGLNSYAMEIKAKRFYEMQTLADCKKVSTSDKPIIVKGLSKSYKVKSLRARFSAVKEGHFSKYEGLFTFEGITIEGSRFYTGAVTGDCIARVGFGRYVECKGQFKTSLVPAIENNEKIYKATIFVGDEDQLTVNYKRNECSFWPHSTPSRAAKKTLLTFGQNNLCNHLDPINTVFRIKKTSNPNNPFEIQYGLPDKRCVSSFLSSKTNYEYWMNSRNTTTGYVLGQFDTKQYFDINGDGVEDVLYLEEVESDPFRLGKQFQINLELN